MRYTDYLLYLNRFWNTWSLEPSEIGVQLSLTIEIIPIRRPVTPISGLACLAFGRINTGMLKDLKGFIEDEKPLMKLKRQISLLSKGLGN